VTRDRKKANARFTTVFVTCHPSLATRLLAVVAVLFFAVPNGRAQPNGVQHASDFTSVEYFEPPHQQQMKSRLSGAEAQPQAGGLVVIKQLKLETFNLDGKPEIIVTAPECVYDTFNHVANSPGHLQLQTGDGKFHVEGDGFLWRQNDSFLTISNHVHTVIENTMK
jgi:hypothetical protein